MELLLPLWLPILLSAAAVWIASMIVGMALPHHKQDWIGLPAPPNSTSSPGGGVGSEDGFMDYLRSSGITPGNYLFPDFRTRAAMETEKAKKALNEGPVGHLSLWKTPLTMGDKMVGTFIVFLVVSILIAYITRIGLPPITPTPGATPPPSFTLPPTPFAKVFQLATTAGVLAYCFSFIPSSLWWGAYKRTILANVIDGILYAAITGVIFAWRWPH